MGGYNDDDEECCTDDNSHLDASVIVFDGGQKSAPTPGLGDAGGGGEESARSQWRGTATTITYNNGMVSEVNDLLSLWTRRNMATG